MLVVELKRLRKDAGPAAEFLRSILDENPKSHGSQLKFTKTRAKDVKQSLHKFLHDHKLENYRIVIAGSNLVENRRKIICMSNIQSVFDQPDG